MKIIIDTNVIIAAFSSHGLCKSLFEFILENHSIVLSEYILNECKRILIKKFKIPDENVNEIITFLQESTNVADYEIPSSQISRDIKDDPILGICNTIKADYLLTGDKDLLVLKKYNDVEIISPRELWTVFKE